jgi:hypothetical protein
MIEAWMSGKPVIGGNIASTRCIIDPGVDGWVVTPFDANDLAARILDLISHPQRRADFGERGRAKVLARYTWDRIADAWEAIFRTVAFGRKAFARNIVLRRRVRSVRRHDSDTLNTEIEPVCLVRCATRATPSTMLENSVGAVAT